MKNILLFILVCCLNPFTSLMAQSYIDKKIEWMQEKMQGAWYSASAVNYYQTDSSLVTVVHNNFIFVYRDGALIQEIKFEIKYGFCNVCMSSEEIFYICTQEIDLETHMSKKDEGFGFRPIQVDEFNFAIYQSFGYRETIYYRKSD